MKKLCLSLIAGLTLLLNLTISADQELISDLHTKIVLNPDASLTVTETITINVQHQKIKRGITRSFPTRYTNQFGVNLNVDFKVIKVSLDNQPCEYFLTMIQNGLVVNFGNDNLISKGQHVYEITYQTNRQLYFKDHWTELYFNIVGNNVIFPILQASVEVYLPTDIDNKKIELFGYTGFFGKKEQNFQSWITRPNVCHFKTTNALQPGESFTISIAFPDSINIKKPDYTTKLKWYLQDNLSIIILLLLIIILLIVYSYIYYYQVYLNKPVITPLFSPPANMLPPECAFIYHKSLPSKALTATILDMAVRDYLKIRYTPGNLPNKGHYTLEKNSKSSKNITPHYDRLSDLCFEKNNKIDLSSANQNVINKILNRLNFITQKYADLIQPIHTILILGLTSSFVACTSIFVYLRSYENQSILILSLVLIFINLIFYRLLKDYTPSGKIVYAQIAGFKMYLEYAEKDRIIKLNPPSMNTEIFEKYLPYAIALDVDIAWTRAFEHIYLRPNGYNYHPYWWLSPRFKNHELNSNLNSLNQNINQIITSNFAPGTTSGRSGSGFSGGGGGGGGIGGR